MLMRDAQQWQLQGCVLGGENLWGMKTTLGGMSLVKSNQPVRNLPVVAKHCSMCSLLSGWPPVEDPDEARHKKIKSGIAQGRSIEYT